jgi:hypothetical protein
MKMHIDLGLNSCLDPTVIIYRWKYKINVYSLSVTDVSFKCFNNNRNIICNSSRHLWNDNFLPTFYILKKMNVRLCDLHAFYMYVNPPSTINFWIPEHILIKLAVYIMALGPISTAYLICPPIGLCLYCIPPIVARQRCGKHVPVARNTWNSKIFVRCVYLCIPLPLLGNN